MFTPATGAGVRAWHAHGARRSAHGAARRCDLSLGFAAPAAARAPRLAANCP